LLLFALSRFAAALHVAMFGRIEAAVRRLDERKVTAHLLI
jgi:hypothetical protein